MDVIGLFFGQSSGFRGEIQTVRPTYAGLSQPIFPLCHELSFVRVCVENGIRYKQCNAAACIILTWRSLIIFIKVEYLHGGPSHLLSLYSLWSVIPSLFSFSLFFSCFVLSLTPTLLSLSFFSVAKKTLNHVFQLMGPFLFINIKLGMFRNFSFFYFLIFSDLPDGAQGNVWMFLSSGNTNLLTLIPIMVLFCIMWFSYQESNYILESNSLFFRRSYRVWRRP